MTQPSLPTVPVALRKCPICNDALVDLSTREGFNEVSAPWLCARDSRAYWPEELMPPMRNLFRPAFRDFGDGEGLKLAADLVAKRRSEIQARRAN